MNRFLCHTLFSKWGLWLSLCLVLDFQGGAWYLEMKQADCTCMNKFLIMCFWAQSCRASKWRKKRLSSCFFEDWSLFEYDEHSDKVSAVCVGSWKWNILATGNFSSRLAAPPCVCQGKLSLKLQKEKGKPHADNHDFERSRIVGESFLKSMLRIWWWCVTLGWELP